MKYLLGLVFLMGIANNSYACQINTSLYTSGTNYAVPQCSQNLILERSGFARPSGGLNTGIVYNVTSLADSGPGTLREGLQNPAWIVFSVSGKINLQTPLRIQNSGNFTIDGRDSAVTLSGYGLYLIDAENIIINNIEIKNGNSDAVDAMMMARSNQVWVHKVSLSNFPDGLLDVTRAPAQKSRVTISWSRFSNHNKAVIIGLTKSFMPSDRHIYVTMHHNYFAGTSQRHPRVSQGYAHVFNNVMFWEDYGMASFDDARLLAEHNFFSAVSATQAVQTSHPSQGAGKVRLVENSIIGNASITMSDLNPNSVGYPWYEYPLESPSDCLWNNVMHSAGSNRDALDLCP